MAQRAAHAFAYYLCIPDDDVDFDIQCLRFPATLRFASLSHEQPSQFFRFESAETRNQLYDYSLSKRTDAYLVCMYDKTSGFGSATTTALGLRHAF